MTSLPADALPTKAPGRRPDEDVWVKVPRALVHGLPPHLLATWCRVRLFDWGRGCHAALATLAGDGMSVRQLQRNLAELEARGLLRAQHRTGETTVWWCVESVADVPPGHGCPGGGDTHDGGAHDARVAQNKKNLNQDQMNHKQGRPGRARPPAAGAPAGLSSSKKSAPRSPKKAPETGAVGVGTPGSAGAPTRPAGDEGGDVLALALPTDLAELPARKRGLSASTVRRLVGQHGPEAVRAAVAGIEQDYQGREQSIQNFGGLLTSACREGWGKQKAAEQAAKAAREAAVEAARPPAGTRWATSPGGQVVPVLSFDNQVVRIPGAVVLRQHWPGWTWSHNPPEGAAAENSEPIAAAAEEKAERTTLAPLHRVLVWAQLKPAKARALADELGVEWADVEAELAARKGQSQP